MSAEPLLSIHGLTVEFPTGRGGWKRVVDDVSLEIGAAESVAVVGESGSGKSVTALTALGLVAGSGRITAGEIKVDGVLLATADDATLRAIRGGIIGTVFQEPSAALNPVLTVGFQIAEAVRCHRRFGRSAARDEARRLLEATAVDEPSAVANSYPHQLSGGQLQRAMIAVALAGAPRLLIADEPTTALDVLTQAQILNLIHDLCDESLALLLISHDLSVVAGLVDRVIVMLGGRIVETAPTREIFDRPVHPFTRQLLDRPSLDGRRPSPSIGVPEPPPEGCGFVHRCASAEPDCSAKRPAMATLSANHRVRCPVALHRLDAKRRAGSNHE